MAWKTFGAFSHVHLPLFCRTEVTVHHISNDLIPTWKCLWECRPRVRSRFEEGRGKRGRQAALVIGSWTSVSSCVLIGMLRFTACSNTFFVLMVDLSLRSPDDSTQNRSVYQGGSSRLFLGDVTELAGCFAQQHCQDTVHAVSLATTVGEEWKVLF